jgi:hypothetical protein
MSKVGLHVSALGEGWSSHSVKTIAAGMHPGRSTIRRGFSMRTGDLRAVRLVFSQYTKICPHTR